MSLSGTLVSMARGSTALFACAWLAACGSRTGLDMDLADAHAGDAGRPPGRFDGGPSDGGRLDAGPPGVTRFIEIDLAPTARAQLAVWIEHEETGRFVTVALTDAVARRGIGNRPGASQMNSGFRWPYGRREGALPYWAHRRVALGGAPFPRVVHQERPEGFASHVSDDSSRDDYFCLSFDVSTTTRDALDAVSCASVFHGDKGRFLTADDVAAGYAEPWEEGRAGSMRTLTLDSLYPPRGDILGDDPSDHPDAARYWDARASAMPELDAVTTATLPSDLTHTFVVELTDDLPSGLYRVYVEANTEGDYNESYGPGEYPTPTLPAGAWDSWSQAYGYPYRGQPSVVFAVDIEVAPPEPRTATAAVPVGRMPIDGLDDSLLAMDATITDDPRSAPGSGADRIRLQADGTRVRVRTGVR